MIVGKSGYVGKKGITQINNNNTYCYVAMKVKDTLEMVTPKASYGKFRGRVTLMLDPVG